MLRVAWQRWKRARRPTLAGADRAGGRPGRLRFEDAGVVVEPEEVSAGGGGEALVGGADEAFAAVLVDGPDAVAEEAGGLFEDLAGVVVAGAVDDDDFVVAADGAGDGVDGAAEEGAAVAGGDDDGEVAHRGLLCQAAVAMGRWDRFASVHAGAYPTGVEAGSATRPARGG